MFKGRPRHRDFVFACLIKGALESASHLQGKRIRVAGNKGLIMGSKRRKEEGETEARLPVGTAPTPLRQSTPIAHGML